MFQQLQDTIPQLKYFYDFVFGASFGITIATGWTGDHCQAGLQFELENNAYLLVEIMDIGKLESCITCLARCRLVLAAVRDSTTGIQRNRGAILREFLMDSFVGATILDLLFQY